MDMNIQKYMAFIKTVEYGSFTKAAEALYYSQSAISRMINDLEKEWNLSLLERSRAGVRLTSDGLNLLPYIKNLCDEYYKLQSQVDELNNLDSGLIRIGTVSSVSIYWLPNIIKKFREDYPNIKYELLVGDYTEIEEWLLDGRVDIGFLSLPTHPDLETVLLEKDELLVILPENHSLATYDVFPVTSLCENSFILSEKGARTEISEIFKKNNISPKVDFTTWENDAVMSMVEKGLGISILPELTLKRIPYRILIKPLDVPEYRNIGVALRNKETSSLVTKKFMEYLKYR